MRDWRPSDSSIRSRARRKTGASRGGRCRRLLIYSHDTFGLGNIRRMLAIAEHLANRDEALRILIVSGSPMIHGFRVSPRIDFVKLPCLSRDRNGLYRSRSLPLDTKALLEMRAQLIRTTAEHFAPDLILVDKKPLGVCQELRPMFETLERLPRRPAVALVLRDILDAPEITRRIWERHRYHEAIARHYDSILVAGQPELFDMAEEYRFPASTRRKMRYCGYLFRGRIPTAAPAPRDTALPTVLVTVGGGGDGTQLIEHFLTALRRSPDSGHGAFRARIVTGPEMAEGEYERLKAMSGGLPGIALDRFVPNLEQRIAEADVVVSMCGYNTVCEVLGAGKRAIVVPRARPVAEQLIRARRFAEHGLLRWIHPDAVTPKHLIQQIEKALSGPAAPSARLDFGGLSRIDHWVGRVGVGTTQRTAAHTLRSPGEGRVSSHVL